MSTVQQRCQLALVISFHICLHHLPLSALTEWPFLVIVPVLPSWWSCCQTSHKSKLLCCFKNFFRQGGIHTFVLLMRIQCQPYCDIDSEITKRAANSFPLLGMEDEDACRAALNKIDGQDNIVIVYINCCISFPFTARLWYPPGWPVQLMLEKLRWVHNIQTTSMHL